MPKETSLGGDIPTMREPGWDYARRLKAKGIPGKVKAIDGRSHIRDFPCPGPQSEPPTWLNYFLTEDRHMWLPLVPDLDLQKVDRILNAAFIKKA